MSTVVATESLADLVRSSTIDEHRAAEGRPFIVQLMGGELSREDYTRYLAQFAWVYEALESRAASAADPVFFDPALARSASVQHDLVALGVEDRRSEHPMLSATAAYVSHLRGIAADDIVRFTAHHYTRYLGDLSGGQAIARLVARNYGLTPDQLTFFDFSALGDLVPYKRAYREALDALELSDAQTKDLITEVRLAYALNSALFDDLAK